MGKQITCAYDSSGRSKCKLTGAKFGKGELKMGTRSHTATNWYKASALTSIIGLISPALGGTLVRAYDVDGYDDMDQTQQQALSAALEGISKRKEKNLKNQDKEKGKKQSAQANSRLSDNQPPTGTVSRVSGRVEWRWASLVCSGTLIASRETKSHCYARTHKGNIKTLAKGKSYWWMC